MTKKFNLTEGFAKIWHDRDEPFIRADITYQFESEPGYGSSVQIEVVLLDTDIKVSDVRSVALKTANDAILALAKQIEGE